LVCLLEIGDLTEAQVDLDLRPLSSEAKRSRVYSIRRFSTAERGDYGAVTRDLDEFDSIGGDESRSLPIRASSAFHSASWADAAKYYRRLIDSDPGVRFSLGASYDNMGEFESAEEIFRDLLISEPQNRSARFAVAVTLSQQGKECASFGNVRRPAPRYGL
ncbi:tetratricopeptide repeat protein, partial [Agrobacterium sp. S2]|nr:tetratricopeptide repeat protein [Agrobacterium sp. S2]